MDLKPLEQKRSQNASLFLRLKVGQNAMIPRAAFTSYLEQLRDMGVDIVTRNDSKLANDFEVKSATLSAFVVKFAHLNCVGYYDNIVRLKN